MIAKKLRDLAKKDKPVASDDFFIRRLNTSIIGGQMLVPGNLKLMDYAIQHMPEGGQILEIGCWAGFSANLILHLTRKYERKVALLSCDPWIYEGIEDELGKKNERIDGHDHILRVDYMNYIYRAYMQAAYLFSPDNLPKTFRLTSDAFFEHFAQGSTLVDIFGESRKLEESFSFCYIDGNHAYDFVKRDFENVGKYLLPQGFILLDDSGDGAPFGSARLMEEIKRNPDYRIVAKNPNYLLQKL